LVAAVLCSSTASKGPFYRHGRERELGFPEVAEAGKISGRGGSGDDVGRVGRSSGVPRLLRTRCGTVLTSATASMRACWSGDREATGELSTVHWPGSGLDPARDRQRRGRGWIRVRLRWLGRTSRTSATVFDLFRIFAHKVFGQMPARNLNSNFRKTLGAVKVFNKVSKDIFIMLKDGVLRKT
jgi:hypothetical protein